MGRGAEIDTTRPEWSGGSVVVDLATEWLDRHERSREKAAAVRRRAALDGLPGAASAAALSWSDADPPGTHCVPESADDLLAGFVASRRLEAWAVWQQLVTIARLLAHRGGVSTEPEPAPSGHRSRRDVDPGGLVEESVVTEIALAAGISEHLAGGRLGAAKALVVDDRLPATAAMLRDGALDWARAQAVVTRTQTLSVDAARAVDALVAPHADQVNVRRFEQAVDRAVLRVDAAAAEERRRRAHRERSVAVFATGDGTATLWAAGPAESVVAISESLTAVARQLRHAGDPRTLEQLRFDLLVTGCTTGFLPCPPSQPEPGSSHARTGRAADPGGEVTDGRTDGRRHEGITDPDTLTNCFVAPWIPVAAPDVPAHITVTVSVETLLGLTDDPAMLDGYGPIAAAMARDLAHHGIWRCVAVDGSHGTVLGVGRSTYTPHYTPGAALRQFLEDAAATCTVPSCGTRAWRCDLDHRRPWAEGGATCDCNIRPLCRRHHRLKTAGLLSLTPSVEPGDPPGTWVVTTPTGRTYPARMHVPLPRDGLPDAADPPPF